jgi:signal peptidase complex subunit 1
MDYEGQKLSELIFYWVILIFGGVGWIVGYMRQEFFIVFKFWLVGVVISIVVRRTNV